MKYAGSENAQVIGVAYTFDTSRDARRALTRHDKAHSSWTDSFSFFLKGSVRDAVPDGGVLQLRPDVPRDAAPHWPEPELAALLGHEHTIVAYALGNDLTAFTVETGDVSDVSEDGDRTHNGKCWPGSCGLGPAFVPVDELGSMDDVAVALRIERAGKAIFDDCYRTSSRRTDFAAVPELIASRRMRLGDCPRESKRVRLDGHGRLPPGTVVLLGSGLIVPPACYCRAGDRITVSCDGIGELTHEVSA